MTRRKWTRSLAGTVLGHAALFAQRQPAEPTALLFGTVFQDTYLALPGARVVAHKEGSPGRKYRTVTNHRGEYRIRVPAGDATYVVTAKAARFAEARRTVQVYGIEKSTANLILERRKARKTGTTGSATP